MDRSAFIKITLALHMYYFLLLCEIAANFTHATSQTVYEPRVHCKEKELCNCCTGTPTVISCEESVLHIPNSFCLTWNNSSNKLEINRCLIPHKPHTGLCANAYNIITTEFTGPELNNLSCNSQVYNRQGPQCRQCIEGYGPAPFSDGVTCADCSKHKDLWILNLTFQLTMVTIMYLAVVLFQIKGTSSPYNILIAYAQIGINALTFGTGLYVKVICFTGATFTTTVLTIMDILNLDFLRLVIPPLCINSSVKFINVILLDYIIAIYPILLTITIYIAIELYDRNCWIISRKLNCLQYRDWKPKETVLNTCTTFLLLSYSKFIFVSFKLLFAVPIYNCNGEITPHPAIILYDPSIRFLHSEHIPYVVVACTVLVVFVLLPPLILLLYPTRLFRKCLSCCGFQRWDILQFLMDIFQGYFKDGTDGTWDYRCISAIYMVLRISSAITCTALALLKTTYEKNIKVGAGVSHVLIGTLFLLLRPYKTNWMNKVDGLILTFLGVVILTTILENKAMYIIEIVIALSLIGLCSFKCLKRLFA